LVTSTTNFQSLSQDQSLKDKEIIAFFLLQDNLTQIDVEYKCNLKIKRISSSFEDISKNLTEYLNTIINKFLKESVYFKAGHLFDCKEACIKYFYNQVIFNLFKSNKLSYLQSKNAFIDYCKSNYTNYGGVKDELEEVIETVENNEFKKNNIIQWYTRDSFFHKLINCVLRKDDICEFFKIRYAINQLSDALSDYEYKSKSDFFVYRPSFIDKAEYLSFRKMQKELITSFKS